MLTRNLLFVTCCGLALFGQGSEELVAIPEGMVESVRVGSFVIGRTEVSQREYRRVMGTNPSFQKGEDLPVERVSWLDAVAYLNKRSQMERLTPCYQGTQRKLSCTGYRLPTDAEWRRAAGSEKPAGNLRNTGHQNPADLAAAAKSGTRPAGPPNALGISDLYGNVWEWCEDWFTNEPVIDAIRDPQGPQFGSERTIRGGSFLSHPSAWNKGFVSSMAPGRRSAYTGFRVARTVKPATLPALESAWLSTFQKVPAGIAPHAIGEISDSNWLNLLGIQARDSSPRPVPAIRIIKEYREPAWNGVLADLDVEPGYPLRILIAEPVRKPSGKLPVAIVPFYDVDSPIGENLGGRRWGGGGPRAFAQAAVQRGMLAVSVRWFAESDGEGYDESVHLLLQRSPEVTPMGKWVLDSRRLIDYLASRPDVDATRIGMIGHSLGGKMTLYASAFDDRVAAVVASEPGISFQFSNYDAFWYLGPKLKSFAQNHDQDELLALIAPRPFLLIAGESADGDKSWPFILSAQREYVRKGNKEWAGVVNHRSGHTPSMESFTAGMEWLERFLRR